MRLALIACNVLCRELSYSIALSKNIVFSYWMEQGLHDTPLKLTQALKDKIQEIEDYNETLEESKKFDAIILGYGLCSNSVIGIESINLPLVIPRCDDCIALFLGSQERYLKLFNENKGVYWYNKAWVERAEMPSKKRYEFLYQKFLEEYEDEDTAEFLLEQETSFIENYENCFYIKSSFVDDTKEQEFSKEVAEEFNWNFKVFDSDMSFISDLVDGNWDERYLVCKKGQTVSAEYTGKKIQAV